jgi:TonB family protein
VKQAPDQARGQTPTRGAQTSAGNAVAVTGARGQGFGLSGGGGPGVAGTLDVGNFCCPDYLMTMVSRIKANWNEQQNVTGVAVVKLTIRRDGLLEGIELEQSSSFPIADLAAQRAVILTKQVPPLPDAFPNPTLTVHLNFQYQR